MLSTDYPSILLSTFEQHRKNKPTYLEGISAVFVRNIKILSRYKLQQLLGFITTLIVFSLYYYLSLLVPEQKITYEGIIVSSIDFIAVGMLTVDLTTRAFKNSLNSFISEMRQGTFTSLAMQPYGLKRYLSTEILFETVYSFIVSLLYYIPVFLLFPIFRDISFNFFSFLSLLTVIASIFVFFYALSLVAATLSLILKRSRELSLIFMAVLQLLSGALFPLYVFPQWLKIIALISPYTLAINALRLCIFKQYTLSNQWIWLTVIILLLASVGLLALFHYLYGIIYKKLKTKGQIEGY